MSGRCCLSCLFFHLRLKSQGSGFFSGLLYPVESAYLRLVSQKQSLTLLMSGLGEMSEEVGWGGLALG